MQRRIGKLPCNEDLRMAVELDRAGVRAAKEPRVDPADVHSECDGEVYGARKIIAGESGSSSNRLGLCVDIEQPDRPPITRPSQGRWPFTEDYTAPSCGLTHAPHAAQSARALLHTGPDLPRPFFQEPP